MNIQLKMCNLYFRDKVKNRGWANAGYIRKLYHMLITLWLDREKMWLILRKKYYYLRQVELVLTTKCSLKCKECANLMQYYKNPCDVQKEYILKSIDNLLSHMDEINTVVLVGGEPFLYKDIADIINYVAQSPKVNYIHIFTNGTIVPRQENICALQNVKVKIIISDYGEISRRKYELVDFCEKNNINYYLKNKDLYWGSVGNMQPRNRTDKQLKKQFGKCRNYCRSILNGKLFYCPRASHGADLCYVKTSKKEYVDLRRDDINTMDILRIVYSNHFFSACDYCNYGTKEMISIIPGVQMNSCEQKNIFEK